MNNHIWNTVDVVWENVKWPKLMMVKQHKKSIPVIALIRCYGTLAPDYITHKVYFDGRFAWKYARIPTEEEVQEVLF